MRMQNPNQQNLQSWNTNQADVIADEADDDGVHDMQGA